MRPEAVPKMASIKIDAFQNTKPGGFCTVGSHPPPADGYFWDSHNPLLNISFQFHSCDVRLVGIEPTTLCLKGRCSNH